MIELGNDVAVVRPVTQCMVRAPRGVDSSESSNYISKKLSLLGRQVEDSWRRVAGLRKWENLDPCAEATRPALLPLLDRQGSKYGGSHGVFGRQMEMPCSLRKRDGGERIMEE